LGLQPDHPRVVPGHLAQAGQDDNGGRRAVVGQQQLDLPTHPICSTCRQFGQTGQHHQGAGFIAATQQPFTPRFQRLWIARTGRHQQFVQVAYAFGVIAQPLFAVQQGLQQGRVPAIPPDQLVNQRSG
jgi:hypothetical protein